MRKEGILVLLTLIFISSFVFADNDTLFNQTSDIEDYSINLAEGFTCLETSAGDACANTNDITELSLTILASPENIFDGCVNKLKQKTTDPTTLDSKELAQAILALDHADENTTSLENELAVRSQSSSSVDWILQVVPNSEEDTYCSIKYGDTGNKYEFNVNSKGKVSEIKSDRCFDLTNFGFWILIDDSCYGNDFTINCASDYKIPLSYKKSGTSSSSINYVLKDTEEAAANANIEFSVESLCVNNNRGSCNYEATLWGAYALKQIGTPVRDYLPYIVTLLDTSSAYFPEAFIPIVDPNLNERYREEIINKQKTDGSWSLSSYGKEYDTALALLSYGISEDTQKSKRWLYTRQNDEGCWKDLETTAMTLWALTQKAAPTTGGGSDYDCTSSGYFCLPSSLCESGNVASSIYIGCSGASNVCCKVNVNQTCAELGGEVCDGGKVCSGGTKPSLDETSCCVSPSSCITDIVSGDTACELADDNNNCYSSTPQDNKNYKYVEQSTALSESCGENKTCYQRVEKGDSSWILWVLIVLILGLVGFLVWKFKDKLKGLFKKKGKGGSANQPQNNQGKPPYPPSRPGMPPMRPPMGMPQGNMLPPNSGMIRQAPPRRGMPPKVNLPPQNQNLQTK